MFAKNKSLKQGIRISLFLLIAALFLTTSYSCSQKTGCPAEDAHVKPDRKGEYANKRGKSNLFPKTMRKKIGG